MHRPKAPAGGGRERFYGIIHSSIRAMGLLKQLMSVPKFESGTYRIRCRGRNRSTTTFGNLGLYNDASSTSQIGSSINVPLYPVF
jgi:hypothetical protein